MWSLNVETEQVSARTLDIRLHWWSTFLLRFHRTTQLPLSITRCWWRPLPAQKLIFTYRERMTIKPFNGSAPSTWSSPEWLSDFYRVSSWYRAKNKAKRVNDVKAAVHRYRHDPIPSDRESSRFGSVLRSVFVEIPSIIMCKCRMQWDHYHDVTLYNLHCSDEFVFWLLGFLGFTSNNVLMTCYFYL